MFWFTELGPGQFEFILLIKIVMRIDIPRPDLSKNLTCYTYAPRNFADNLQTSDSTNTKKYHDVNAIMIKNSSMLLKT